MFFINSKKGYTYVIDFQYSFTRFFFENCLHMSRIFPYFVRSIYVMSIIGILLVIIVKNMKK